MNSNTATYQVQLELNLAADRQSVWKAVIEDSTHWWRKDFYVGPAKAFLFEPKLGGRLFEDWGEGAGVLWYTVIAIDPPNSIDLVGYLTPMWGGPAISMLRLELHENEAATVLKVSDAILGPAKEQDADTKKEGWMLLFGQGLKPYIESGRRA